MNNFGNNNRKQFGKEFEQQFKNKFENAQFTPPAHLWEQIDAALDAKPWYKRPLFYWTSGLVAALLLVVMFWFTLVYEGANMPSATTIVNTDKIEKTTINPDKSIDDTINPSSTNEGIRTIQTPNDSGFNTIETNPVQEKELIISSTTKTTSSNSNLIISDKNSTSSDNSNKNSNSTSVVSTPIKDNNNNKETSKTTSSNLLVDKTKNTDLASIDFKEIDWSKYLPVGNPYFEKEVIVKIDSTKETIANNQKALDATEDAKTSAGIAITFGINHTQGIYKPTFRTDSIYSGLKVIEAVKSNLADTLPQMNISGNYQQTGFDVALAFGKNKHWSINTGIAKGKANYSFGSSNYTPFINDIPNDQNPLIAHYNNQVEVNYEWLQVPIAIGYQFGESRAKKITGFAQLGTAIEFLSSHSYTSADPKFTYAMGTHRTTNTQVWTQVGVNYHITNRWAIWGGGTYKSSLSSLISENGVTFSSQAYGWQVGTRFTVFNSNK